MDEGWQQATRSKVKGRLKLRQEDWKAKVVSYEDLVNEVISAGGGLREVLHCQAEELEVAETMCKGKVEGVLVVIQNKDSEKSIPMEDERGRMIMRNMQITTIGANGMVAYSKHGATNVVKVQKETTTVLWKVSSGNR